MTVCSGCAAGFEKAHQDQTRCATCVLTIIHAIGNRSTPAVLSILEAESGKPTLTLNHLVTLLNEILEAEPKALTALFQYRVMVPGATIQNHPSIQTYPGEDGETYLGILGILNSLFGLSDGRGAISIRKKGQTGAGHIEEFLKTEDFVDRMEDVPKGEPDVVTPAEDSAPQP